MANFQPKRGTSSQNDSHIGSIGEVTIDAQLKIIRVHDGVTQGGTKQAALNANGQLPYQQLPQAAVGTPVVVSPANGATVTSTSPTLQIGSFWIESGLTTLSHTHTQWQVSSDAQFNTVVYNSGDSLSLTSIVIPTGLQAQTVYYWRARYKDSNGNYSPWLATSQFTTSVTYVDDVFSTYLYTGNGSTQTINNGIDLAGNGGLVWIKNRGSSADHVILSSPDYALSPNTTAGSGASFGGLGSFAPTGFNLANTSLDVRANYNGHNYASWIFRKAPKFFDVVTYTGNGAAGRQIPHELGVAPGMITTKSTNTTGNWNTYHRSATGDLKLNLTDAQTASRTIITATDADTFTVSGVANTNGVTYVAYLFAHDPSADGIIQCGSYVGNGVNYTNKIELGFEPQYVLLKNASSTGNWYIVDNMRGNPVGNQADRVIHPHFSTTESDAAVLGPTATGFSIKGSTAAVNGVGNTYIYLAIRRPNKPPTSGSQVYNSTTRGSSGDGQAPGFRSGFPVDMSIERQKNVSDNFDIRSRLTGVGTLITNTTQSENTSGDYQFGFMNGSFQWTGTDVYNQAWMFRRAPGFMDEVCDTGTAAAHAISHNLTKTPELLIRKSRSASTQWEVWHSALAATEKLVLNSTAAKATDATAWNSTAPTATQFTVGTGANVNANAATFVTYLFASLPGISKVGSYTGNGGAQTIACGFSTGARFILIKRTDSTGDWLVADTARGLIDGSDPTLRLNSTAAEFAEDWVDYNAYGFSVNQVSATNINVSGGQYIFLAIA